MKYILSGCTGHLGLNLVKYLLSAGKSVKAIALPGENTEKLSEHGAEVVYGDVTDRDFVFSQVEQGCVFFHLAGIIDITSGNKDKVYLVNVKGTENVADACLAKGARLVYTSSVHVIPPAKKGREGDNGENEYTTLPPFMIADIMVPVPVDGQGNISLDAQKEIAAKYLAIEQCKNEVISKLDSLIQQKIEL